ncbi:MAG: hypothetical protein QXI18_03945 [Nitrososphaerota archaeon]
MEAEPVSEPIEFLVKIRFDRAFFDERKLTREYVERVVKSRLGGPGIQIISPPLSPQSQSAIVSDHSASSFLSHFLNPLPVNHYYPIL